jgi:hypothetical protein
VKFLMKPIFTITTAAGVTEHGGFVLCSAYKDDGTVIPITVEPGVTPVY